MGVWLSVSWQPALAVGVYLDVAGDLTFLTAPRERALAGRLVRSNGDEAEASIYVLDAAFPVRSYALVELNLPLITLVEPSRVESGLGDLSIRARARLFRQPKRVLHLVANFRTGSGTTRVYPYSSQSTDLRVAIGYVDTLELFGVWSSVGGTYVSREPKNRPEDELHGPSGHVAAGIHIPIATGLRIGAGLVAVFFEAGRAREIYLATLDYHRSQRLVLMFSAQAEGGRSEERVSDSVVSAGLRVYY
jgi:hypothetical protein